MEKYQLGDQLGITGQEFGEDDEDGDLGDDDDSEPPPDGEDEKNLN